MRFNNAVHDHRGTKTCAQAQKKHFAVLVTAQSLHGGVIDDLDRAFEGSFKIETLPTLSQVPRFGNGPVLQDGPRVTDGNGVIFPVG